MVVLSTVITSFQQAQSISFFNYSGAGSDFEKGKPGDFRAIENSESSIKDINANILGAVVTALKNPIVRR